MATKKQCSIDGCSAVVASRGWCSKHYTRWQRHGDPLFITRNEPSTADAAEKWCPRCSKIKPIDEFGRRSNGRPKGYCITCDAHYHAQYAKTDVGRKAHRAASQKWHGRTGREYHLQYRYGISQDEFEALREAQGDRCAICGTDKPDGGKDIWCVDHCHDTLEVRGLLCSSCNLGIGYFKDSPEFLRAAASYLDSQGSSSRSG